MLKVDYGHWEQTPDHLRQLALTSEHPRTRERFLALYEIAIGQSSATQISQQSGRNHQTVMGWVHQYNHEGCERLLYRRTGGSLPLFAPPSPTT